MKTTRSKITVFALAILTALIVSSCDNPVDSSKPISVQDTMSGFIKDANVWNYLALKQYTHSQAEKYSVSGTKLYWETYILENVTHLGNPQISGTTATVESDDHIIFTFELQIDSPDQYKIRRITSNDANGNFFY